ncbi:MAG: biotin/lipoyl-binding protein [Pseudomonadota bacterium]|nr:biotin/lipoyl-binding protein [Pseudomonadota bacterium]
MAAALQGDIALSPKVVARVEAWSTVTMRARVSGQLQSLSFEPGALVRKGSVLAQIDQRLLKAQILTLYLTPVIYLSMDRLQQWFQRKGQAVPTS